MAFGKYNKISETNPSICATHAKSLQSCLTLCDPTDYNPTGSSVHGILQASVLEWVAVPLNSRASSRPRDRTSISYVSALAGRFFTTSTTWEAQTNPVKVKAV